MIVPVDKPQGASSAACVRRVGRACGLRAGHAGTLDPGATGLLVVCLGESRKLSGLLSGHDKSYSASMVLGTATDTLDAWGRIVEERPVPPVSLESVREIASRFTGRILQTVPAFSAVKRDGRALHRLARRGMEVNPPRREVVVHDITVTRVEGGRIDLDVSCGPGTFIRSLVRDIALAIGTVGHLAALRRLQSGALGVAESVGLDRVLEEARAGGIAHRAVSHARALEGHRLLIADHGQGSVLRRGRPVRIEDLVVRSAGADPVVVLDSEDRAVCIALIRDGLVHPRRVLLAEEV